MTDPSNGGSSITSYHVEWDAGSNGATWETVIGLSPSYTGLSASVTGGTSGLTVGTNYKFRIRARNIHGWGIVSSESIIKAAQAPSQVPSVATSIHSTNGAVVISWSAPSSNGETISSYLIEVFN